MRILHTVGSLGEEAGGPSRTVPSLCMSLQKLGALEIQILTSRASRFGANRKFESLSIQECGARTTRDWGVSLAQTIGRNWKGNRTACSILHDHGQWLPINQASANVSRKLGIPRIVTPRGMLSPWAMNFRRWKKQIAWRWFAQHDITSANVLHATSSLEASELRDLGLRNPIAIIANGVDALLTKSEHPDKKRQVIFLSRIHPKKGVVELVEAWRRLKPRGWELIIAGPDEAHIVPALNLDAAEPIHYIGEVEGEHKWRALAESSIFVLPSYSENFGVVVAEALRASTPVIATHGTPWKSLVDHECGWWIPMTPESLEETLRIATSLDEDTLRAMGERGRTHAIESFAWPAIGKQMADVYRWMLDLGDKPDCVQLD